MRLKNLLICCAGFLFLVMGVIGMALPLLPTTPFVIAAASCFVSTPKVYERVMKVPFFNEYIRSYQEKNGLRPRTVVASLTFLWGTLILSMLRVHNLWVTVFLGLVGISVTVHILWISKAKTK